MDYFQYQGNSLHCEEVPLRELALQYQTPLYVYSYKTLARHYRVFEEALSDMKHLICFSAKANSNLAILRAVASMGGGADVVSGGELFRCLEAGMPAKKILFSGVGKSIQEIEYALRRKILMINVESAFELRQIGQIAEGLNLTAPISFRVNPDVDPKTHPYISTGLHENKFGISTDEAQSLYREAARHPALDPIGLDFHIGSQLLEIDPFVDAMKIAVDLVRDLRRNGINLSFLDCGGGLGVRYREEEPPSPDTYARALLPLLKDLDLTLVIEPGRSLMANAGVLLTRVLHVKKTSKKTFVIVDAAMNDLLRPALYNAEHAIDFVNRREGESIVADVVGPVCETGDFLARDYSMTEPMEGDLLCVRTAGAYGFAMSSQYNSRPRVAETLVRGGESWQIRKRETFDDLIAGEQIPDWLAETV